MNAIQRHSLEYEILAAVHDCAGAYGCPAAELDVITDILAGVIPSDHETQTMAAYAAIEATPALMRYLEERDFTFCELVDWIADQPSAGDIVFPDCGRCADCGHVESMDCIGAVCGYCKRGIIEEHNHETR